MKTWLRLLVERTEMMVLLLFLHARRQQKRLTIDHDVTIAEEEVLVVEMKEMVQRQSLDLRLILHLLLAVAAAFCVVAFVLVHLLNRNFLMMKQLTFFVLQLGDSFFTSAASFVSSPLLKSNVCILLYFTFSLLFSKFEENVLNKSFCQSGGGIINRSCYCHRRTTTTFACTVAIINHLAASVTKANEVTFSNRC
jgi:hypothetical protein